jgi:hypothetical protein
MMMDLVNRIEGSGVGSHVGKVWAVREEDREIVGCMCIGCKESVVRS